MRLRNASHNSVLIEASDIVFLASFIMTNRKFIEFNDMASCTVGET